MGTHRRAHVPTLLTVLVALVAALLPSTIASASSSTTTVVAVSSGPLGRAVRAVRDHGGAVEHRISFIDAVVAEVPASEVDDLRADDRISSLTPDYRLKVQSDSFGGDLATTAPASVRATDMWSQGYTGRGVGVAILDTGVADHPDLAGRVVASADLTNEGTFSDSFGHGTFLAGLVAGDGTASGGRYTGIAPEASLVSVKVAGSDGATTLGQILYGLQLIDSSKSNYNVRVVMLALGGPAVSGPDPLVLAVERMWADGLVVVTAAGNSGPSSGSVTSPGTDPYVITVGATNENGTATVEDDSVPSWSAQGPSVYGFAKPDLVAPGTSVVGLRAPNSTVDLTNPGARVEDSYFRGSGTSMSVAVAAGAAALMLEANPGLTPDEVKGRLMATAHGLAGAGPEAQGRGALDVLAAATTAAPPANADLPPLPAGPVDLPTDVQNRRTHKKERSFDWFTSPIGPDRWLGRAWAGKVWSGNRWTGRAWAGRAWAHMDFSGRAWADSEWAGRAWAGRAWAGRAWAGGDWSGRAWAGTAWQAVGWP